MKTVCANGKTRKLKAFKPPTHTKRYKKLFNRKHLLGYGHVKVKIPDWVAKRNEQNLKILKRRDWYKNILKVNDKRIYYREEYLKSEHWKKLRNDKLILNPVCERCGNKQRTEPHHLRYKNLFDVTIEDLMTLCRKCHYLEHHL